MSTIRRCRPLLGTFVEVCLSDRRHSESALHELADLAFGALAKVQSLMSFHESSSDLSRLNQTAHLAPVAVHAWTHHVLHEAIRLGHASGGIFDVAVAPALIRWGFLPDTNGHGDSVAGTFREITLHDDGRVSFQKPLQLDLGGIAKGFAVDMAADLLEQHDIQAGKVDAGGDIRFTGELPASIHVRHPSRPHGEVVSTPLYLPAVATSASSFAVRQYQGRTASHFVHPPTNEPTMLETSATVFAPRCLHADALTKVVLMGEPRHWKPMLDKEGARALLLDSHSPLPEHCKA